MMRRFDVGECDNPTAWDNPLCLEMVGTRSDTRVLAYENARDVCKSQTYGVDKGLLPWPRSALEAMSFVGYARARGIYAFWAHHPVAEAAETTEDYVEMHWYGVDKRPFKYPKGETRCVLIDTLVGDMQSSMFARLQPCGMRRADGVMCEQASAAPPPPPGQSAPPPPPPPPPMIRERSLRSYVSKEVLPRTHLVCTTLVDGSLLRRVCLDTLKEMSRRQVIGFVAGVIPLCEPKLCFGGCDSDDGWHNCKLPECADSPCKDFLVNACPSGLQDEITRVYNKVCGVGVDSEAISPLPPPPPPPPPFPTSPKPLFPPSPPPSDYLKDPRLEFRHKPDVVSSLGTAEQAFMSDCMPIDYEVCKKVVEAYAGAQFPDVPEAKTLRLNSPCEGSFGADMKTTEDFDCFIGCSFGSQGGGTYTMYKDYTQSGRAKYNGYRCNEADQDYCVCYNAAPPPPNMRPPPMPIELQDWAIVNDRPRTESMEDKSKALAGAFVREFASRSCSPNRGDLVLCISRSVPSVRFGTRQVCPQMRVSSRRSSACNRSSGRRCAIDATSFSPASTTAITSESATASILSAHTTTDTTVQSSATVASTRPTVATIATRQPSAASIAATTVSATTVSPATLAPTITTFAAESTSSTFSPPPPSPPPPPPQAPPPPALPRMTAQEFNSSTLVERCCAVLPSIDNAADACKWKCPCSSCYVYDADIMLLQSQTTYDRECRQAMGKTGLAIDFMTDQTVGKVWYGRCTTTPPAPPPAPPPPPPPVVFQEVCFNGCRNFDGSNDHEQFPNWKDLLEDDVPDKQTLLQADFNDLDRWRISDLSNNGVCNDGGGDGNTQESRDCNTGLLTTKHPITMIRREARLVTSVGIAKIVGLGTLQKRVELRMRIKSA